MARSEATTDMQVIYLSGNTPDTTYNLTMESFTDSIPITSSQHSTGANDKYNQHMTNKDIKTFSSINFYPIGMYAKGCKGMIQLDNGYKVTVFGGINDRGADGASTFDVRVVDSKGKPARISGYAPYQRMVSQDDITCMLIQAQSHGRRKKRWAGRY